MGIYLGEIISYNPNKGYIKLKLENSINIGDTLKLSSEDYIYTVSELLLNDKNILSPVQKQVIEIGRIKGNINVGDKVYKMSSKALSKELLDSFAKEFKKQKLDCKITIKNNTPISVNISTVANTDSLYNGITFNYVSDFTPEPAVNAAITENSIIEKLSKTGDTIFEFNNIDIDLDDNLYIPVSKLNDIRRCCLADFENMMIDRIHRDYTVEINTSISPDNNTERTSSYITTKNNFSFIK